MADRTHTHTQRETHTPSYLPIQGGRCIGRGVRSTTKRRAVKNKEKDSLKLFPWKTPSWGRKRTRDQDHGPHQGARITRLAGASCWEHIALEEKSLTFAVFYSQPVHRRRFNSAALTFPPKRARGAESLYWRALTSSSVAHKVCKNPPLLCTHPGLTGCLTGRTVSLLAGCCCLQVGRVEGGGANTWEPPLPPAGLHLSTVQTVAAGLLFPAR